MKDNLDTNAADRWASVIKKAGSIVPGAGPILTEILAELIPNQRGDRIRDYVRCIEMRIQVLEAGMRDLFESNARSEYGTAFIENSFIQSARAVEPESRERIAALVVRSLSEEELRYERTQTLLNLYSELSTKEAVLLICAAIPPSRRVLGEMPILQRRKEIEASAVGKEEIQGLRVGDQESAEARAFIRYHLGRLKRLGLATGADDDHRSTVIPTAIGVALVRLIALDADGVSEPFQSYD